MNDVSGRAPSGGGNTKPRRKEIVVEFWNEIRLASKPVSWSGYVELWDAGLLKFQKEKQPKPEHYPEREEALAFAKEDAANAIAPQTGLTQREKKVFATLKEEKIKPRFGPANFPRPDPYPHHKTTPSTPPKAFTMPDRSLKTSPSKAPIVKIWPTQKPKPLPSMSRVKEFPISTLGRWKTRVARLKYEAGDLHHTMNYLVKHSQPIQEDAESLEELRQELDNVLEILGGCKKLFQKEKRGI